MKTKYLKINPADNVAVAIVALAGRQKNSQWTERKSF